ncbi:hypothetical protein [Muriicola sp. Z0-33]|uniref:hypothetical protein n=1 Tax=Muriicola sp. Z0-33 TaxID=2816957 RepID=UPI0022373541|nr:hypothetical protein [Muriicola sp. Z0-33]MCW5516771.1 hypothetical protein [Muriicola sp. Z0-33]
MKNISLHSFVLFLCLGLICSCTEKQDFDQYDDISVTPTVEGSILYVETPERIINQIVGISFYSQIFNFDAFSEDFIAERVLDGVVIYEVENTTSKQLNISVEFLDAADNVLDIESFAIDPAPTAVLRREIAYGGTTGRSIDIIRNTSSIRVSAENLGDNTSTSSLPDPKIVLRSSAKFRIRLK